MFYNIRFHWTEKAISAQYFIIGEIHKFITAIKYGTKSNLLDPALRDLLDNNLTHNADAEPLHDWESNYY